MEDEYSWVWDYLGAAIGSKQFTVPLEVFVDDNCIVFDDDEENKLAYTEIHKVRHSGGTQPYGQHRHASP